VPSKSSASKAAKAPEVLIASSGDVLSFTLNAPSRENHVSGAMFDDMLAALRAESNRASARALRIRSTGPVFCMGRERAGRNRREILRESKRLITFKRALRESSLITIAEVQGDAFGFGFGLAIVCDFVLVAETAKLGFPEMRMGLAPSAIMAYLGEYTLPRWAFPLILFGEAIEPQRALQIGLISSVCHPGDLSSEADALVAKILRLDASATRNCKQFFLAAQQTSFAANCRAATAALTSGSLALVERAKANRS
jgi:methylglutaconyl-CoA hydratase